MGTEENKYVGDFSFSYGKEDVRDCVIHTERELRNIIDLVLSEKFGLGWETDPTVGFDTEQKKTLQLRQDTEARRMHNHRNGGRLIDYTYIQDLAGLVYKHWDPVFSGLFHWNLRNAEHMFGVLLNYRDIFMHGRDEDVPIYGKYLCLGVCGEILHAISDWHLGFRHRGDILSYKCSLFFSVSEEDPECESKARGLTERWIDAITKLSSNLKQKLDDDGRHEKWLIRLTEGSVKLTIDKRLNKRTELITGETSKDYCGIDVTLETESVQALDKAIVNGRHPFWYIKMVTKSRFDMERIKSNAEHLGKHVSVSGGWSKVKERSISSIGFVLFEGYNDIYPVPKFEIDAEILLGSSESGSSIQLSYQGGMITEGFYQAHRVLLPNTVLSILYDKVQGPDIRQMVLTVVSLPTEI